MPTPPPVEATVRTLRPAELPLPGALPRATGFCATDDSALAVERDGRTG